MPASGFGQIKLCRVGVLSGSVLIGADDLHAACNHPGLYIDLIHLLSPVPRNVVLGRVIHALNPIAFHPHTPKGCPPRTYLLRVYLLVRPANSAHLAIEKGKVVFLRVGLAHG